jgi:predicted dehydrogenase
MMVHARVNVGYLSPEHWTQNPAEGGRVIGELCHFVDWAFCMVGSSIRTVSASSLPDGSRYNGDNLTVTMSFADGSIANILYLANGDSSVPKEYFEIFCEGGVARMEDFRTLELSRNRKTRRTKFARDKGHCEEFRATLQAMASGAEAPIALEELAQVTMATFAVREALATGGPASLRSPELWAESRAALTAAQQESAS